MRELINNTRCTTFGPKARLTSDGTRGCTYYVQGRCIVAESVGKVERS